MTKRPHCARIRFYI